MQHLEVVSLENRLVQRLGGGAKVIVQRAQTVGSVSLERNPELERVDPARAEKAP
jgi:hypothetical protein